MSSNQDLEKRNKILERRWKILLVLAILFLLTRPIALYITHNLIRSASENAVKNNYPLIDPMRKFMDKEDLIVNVEPLREYLKSLPDQNKDWADMSIYFEVLNTGVNISVNPDTKILPASLMKLPAAMEAMKKVEKGEWAMDTQFTLTPDEADIIGTPDIKQYVGKNFSLSFLLDRMLLESDNTSYKMIIKQFTDKEILSLPEEVGLDKEFITGRKIGAKDYTRMLHALYSATYLNEEHSQQLLELLVKSKAEKLVRAGIPSEIPFAHKWGTSEPENVYSDSGIVYIDKRPYIISVMIAGKGSDQAADKMRAGNLMKDIGKHTYDFMSQK